MNYEIAKAARNELERELNAASDVIAAFPSGAFGLTPDHVKATKEWQQAYRTYQAKAEKLRAFNARFTKQYKKEIHAERKARYSEAV